MLCRSFICAQSIIIDRASNRASAINILEEIQFASYPNAIQAMIFSSYEKNSETDVDRPEIQISMLLNGEPIRAPIQLNVNFQERKNIAKNLLSVGVIPINSEGVLTFRLSGAIEYSYNIYIKTVIKDVEKPTPSSSATPTPSI